jgi:hypothetical protein
MATLHFFSAVLIPLVGSYLFIPITRYLLNLIVCDETIDHDIDDAVLAMD